MPPIDLMDVEEPKGPELLAKGTYRGTITDAEEREIKSGDHKGGPAYNIEITMSECINDIELECEGRKVWDFVPVIPPGENNGKKTKGTYGRIKQILRVTGVDVDGSIDLEDVDGDGTTFVEHLNGREVIVKVNLRKGSVNKETGTEYSDKNTIASYHTNDEFEDDIA